MELQKPKRATRSNSKYIYLLALLPFLLVVLLYELLPLIMLAVDSFGLDKDPSVRFTFDNYTKIFTTLSYTKAILNSLKITAISTAFGIVIAVLGARAAHTSRGKFRNVFYCLYSSLRSFFCKGTISHKRETNPQVG